MNHNVVISRREHGPPLSVVFVARQNNRNFNKGTELDILLVFWLLVAPNTNHYVATRDWGRLKQHQHHSIQSTTHPYSKMFNILGAQHYHCVPHKTATCIGSRMFSWATYIRSKTTPCPTRSHIYNLRASEQTICWGCPLPCSCTMYWPSTMYHMLVRFPNLTNHMLTVHYHVPIITKVQLTMHYVPCTDHPLQPKPHYSWML